MAPTVIEILEITGSFIAGEKITFQGTLTDEHGQNLLSSEAPVGGILHLFIDDIDVGPIYTSQSNATTTLWNITYDVPSEINYGGHSASVKFLGGFTWVDPMGQGDSLNPEYYLSSLATINFNISQLSQVIITTPPSDVDRNDLVLIEGQLTDKIGREIPGRNLEVFMNEQFMTDLTVDENGDTTSYGIVFTPSYDWLAPYGDFTFSADFLEIKITDYVTTFSLVDFMEACYDAASYPNNFCNNFQRGADGQVVDFQVGSGNSGIIDFATWIYRANWSQDFATVLRQPEGTLGDVDVSWRAYQQDQRFVADSGDPADLVDKTGWSSDPEWSWDLTVGWSYNKFYAYYQADYVDGGWINKQKTDIRADRYLGANGQPITEYDSYWFDTIGLVYRPNDNMSFSVRVNNPLDHDGSESRYQTERRVLLVGRTITTQFKLKF